VFEVEGLMVDDVCECGLLFDWFGDDVVYASY